METLASIIESILFVSGNEVAVKDISDKLGIPEKDILNEAKKIAREEIRRRKRREIAYFQ